MKLLIVYFSSVLYYVISLRSTLSSSNLLHLYSYLGVRGEVSWSFKTR